MGPNYAKVVFRRCGDDAPSAATFCFIARTDAPFDWGNYRAGDILPPKTARAPWKMDSGAVGNVLDPVDPVSYWVRRYGADLGLWGA